MSQKFRVGLSTLFAISFFGAGLLAINLRPEWSICFVPSIIFMFVALAAAY